MPPIIKRTKTGKKIVKKKGGLKKKVVKRKVVKKVVKKTVKKKAVKKSKGSDVFGAVKYRCVNCGAIHHYYPQDGNGCRRCYESLGEIHELVQA